MPETLKRILRVIADIVAVALLGVVIFTTVRFRLVRTTADVLGSGPVTQSWILVDKRDKALKDLGPGDIVLFRYFSDATHMRVGRILALPGDTVWAEDGAAYTNGQRISEANGRDCGHINPRVVPDDAVFLSEGRDGNPLTSGYRMNNVRLIYGTKVAVLFPLSKLSFGGFRLFVR